MRSRIPRSISAPHEPLGESESSAGPSVAQRIIMTLEACATSSGPMTLTAIIDETGLAKTTVHRMCWRLVELGLLEHSPRGFVIGTKMFAMASSNPMVNRVRVAAMPILMDLQMTTNGMSNLAILSGGKALVLDALYAPRPELPRLVGGILPLHCTAVGKAIAASLDTGERDMLLGDGLLPAATWRSIVRPGLLREHLVRVAVDGLAISEEEFLPGVCGVAAAVQTGGVTVAIGFVGQCGPGIAQRASGPVRRAAAALEMALA